MYHVKRARLEGTGNDFGKVTFQSEIAAIMLQLQQHRQSDKDLMFSGGRCSREERATRGASHSHSLSFLYNTASLSPARHNQINCGQIPSSHLCVLIIESNSVLKASDKLSAYSLFD
jgi:hypothetical protein